MDTLLGGGAKVLAGLGLLLGSAGVASAGLVHIDFADQGNGLSAEADFELLDPLTLRVRFQNTSTGVPGDAEASDQILTGLAWDFGEAGPGVHDVRITGGTVRTGLSSSSIGFSERNVGPDEDVSGEWGFSNSNFTGLLQNFITATQAQSTPFGGENLDGPVNIDGPQGGLVSDPLHRDLGGLGAIQNEIIATLNLSREITMEELIGDFANHGLRVEFGSDYYFLQGMPAPGVLPLLGLVCLAGSRRRRQ